MKIAKLMVVQAKASQGKKFIGQIFDARVFGTGRTKYHIIGRDGFPNYSVNPSDLDEGLTIRIGHGPDDIIFYVEPVSKASQRKLLVRAFKLIARHRGWTDAQVRKGGNFANIADWARSWADWYFDRNGSFVSTHTNWIHGTEHDPVNGDQWYEFAEAEIDNQ